MSVKQTTKTPSCDKILLGIILVMSVHSVGRCDDGSLEKAFSRKDMLEYIAAPIPVEFYEVPFTDAVPKNVSLPKPKIVRTSEISLTPFSPDWMPLSGSSFNQLPYQSVASQIVAQGTEISNSPYVSKNIRNIVDNFLAGNTGESDTSRPLPVISKLAFLENAIKQRSEKGFNFDELVDANVKFPRVGDIEDRYYKTVTDRDIYYFHDPGVPNWWGFCDRGAVANLNPESSIVKKEFEGGFCGAIPVSAFDVDDMLAFLQPMDNSLRRFGMNRGNITEEHSLSPEVVQFEEALGTRPLEAEDFLKLLVENVRPNGRGVIVDESSDPRDSQYNASGIWNRPVFAFSESETEKAIEVSKLTLPLLLRYGSFISKLTLINAGQLTEAIVHWQKEVKENDSAFNAWLESEYAKRVTEKGFKRKDQVLSSTPPDEMEAAYKETRKKVKNAFEKVSRLAIRFKDHLESSTQSVVIRETAVRIWFPRQRRDWNYGPAPLFSREYRMVSLKSEKGITPRSWNVSRGDYPPDLLIVPGRNDLKNLKLLESVLKRCTPLKSIKDVVSELAQLQKGQAEKSSRLLAHISSKCLGPYLNEEAVGNLFNKLGFEFNKGSFLAKSQRCLATWPSIPASKYPARTEPIEGILR